MKKNNGTSKSTYWLMTLLVLCCTIAAWAAASKGAIYTTLPVDASNNATTDPTAVVSFIVNANTQYPGKVFAFLNGGPQNTNSAGLDPGVYYFQVTAPPGAQGGQEVLLSADDATCRQIVVGADGHIGGLLAAPSAGFTGTVSQAGCPDRVQMQDTVNGGFPVQLCPAGTRAGDNLGNGTHYDPGNWCDSTPNNGGEYKVWFIKNISTTVPNGPYLTFDSGNKKTDTFKLKPGTDCSTCNNNVIVWPIAGYKFYDTNTDGVQATSGEPGINGWRIKIFGNLDGASPVFADGVNSPTVPCSITPSPAYVSCDPTTNTAVVQTYAAGTPFIDELGNTVNAPYDGYYRFDDLAAGGTYGVCELVPASANVGFTWKKSAACPKTYNPFEGVNLTSPYVDAVTSTAVPNEYNLAYPATVTHILGFDHLGRGDAVCSDASTGNPANAFYTNIDDIFESGPAGTYPGTAVFPNVPTWDGAYPGGVFGNYCANTPSGGLTKGFWSNKNGALVLGNSAGAAYVDGLADPSNAASPLHFVGQSLDLTCASSTACAAGTKSTWNAAYLPTPGTAGTPFSGSLICTTSSSSCLDYWLTNGSNSANAANQLSVQMVAAVLNINKGAAAIAGGFLAGPALTTGTYVYAPGTNCAAAANLGGYATLGCVITEANTVLGLQQSDGKWAYAPSTSTATCNVGGALGTVLCRTYETNLQNILNNVNNNIAGPVPPAGAGITLCGLNYTGSESCSVPFIARPTAPLQ